MMVIVMSKISIHRFYTLKQTFFKLRVFTCEFIEPSYTQLLNYIDWKVGEWHLQSRVSLSVSLCDGEWRR